MQPDQVKTTKSENPTFSVRSLSFSYGKTKVLEDISFDVEQGKITTVMGANGCGKSTLFALMTRNLVPLKGSIRFRGRDIRAITLREFAREVAIVHQHSTASADITVEQLVSFGRTPHKRVLHASGEEDEKKILWAMEATNLSRYRDRELGRLSGGQLQRVWIAMALAQETRILLLDEPTTYLDIRYQIETLELIRKLNRTYGLTIVMVLHDINQAIGYSDRIIGLKGGNTVITGSPEEVITEESIEALYGIRLRVRDIEGKRVVLTAG